VSVPFLDLARLHESVRDDLEKAFARVLHASAFIGGEEVQEFERAFASAHGRRAAAGCGSGTDALALALRALGVGPGHEVVVPAMTFVATAEAVVHVGATPVIADVDPASLLLTPETVDAVASERTKAVVPVHLYGHVVPFEHLEAWRRQGLIVVEDAAQAHLGEWRGEAVGTVGHAACFSFYPGKNLGALGDGGMVVSDDAELVDEIARLRDHGRATKYEHDEIGWCSRLDGLQAAFRAAKLGHLPRWTDARRRHAERYRERLGELLVPWEDGAVHHLLVVRVAAGERARIQADLRAGGVGSGVHYPVSLSRQPSTTSWSKPCPAAEAAADEVLSLPMDPLMSAGDVDRVCDALVTALKRG
jgi:dTDP-4-amino-4,6-dideoxygalactose transaminase